MTTKMEDEIEKILIETTNEITEIIEKYSEYPTSMQMIAKLQSLMIMSTKALLSIGLPIDALQFVLNNSIREEEVQIVLPDDNLISLLEPKSKRRTH